MNEIKKVLVLGDIMVDVVVAMNQELQRGSDTSSQISQTVGGTGVNVATWSKNYGADVLIIGCIGNDISGQFIQSHLHDWGISNQLKVLPEIPTGIVVALAHPDGERSMFPDSRANSYLSADQFEQLDWREFTHLYVSGYTLFNPQTRNLALSLMQLCQEQGLRVMLDPASAAPISALDEAEITNWLKRTNILLPNEMELESLLNLLNCDVNQLLDKVETLIVKKGAKGAIWINAEQEHSFPAKPTNVVDSVGAGDAFAGALLAALSMGEPMPKAIEQATTAGAISVATRGAQPVKG